jgi:hypothetical protein
VFRWPGQRAFLLHNVPCAGRDEQCSSAQRTFRLTIDPQLVLHSNVLLSAFFDFNDDVSLFAWSNYYRCMGLLSFKWNVLKSTWVFGAF